MTPFFFGHSPRQLYGAYHAPRHSAFRDSAVLFCSPIAQEYMRSHWMLRRLAEQLAGEGFHVLRFDYSCCGDSSGDFFDASVAQWLEDIYVAGDELLNTSGASQLSIVGLRFGATLAALSKGLPVNQLILADPVVEGSHYVDQLRRMHVERLADRHRYPVPRVEGVDFDEREILGFWFSEALEQEIRRANLSERLFIAAKEIGLIASVDGDEYRALKRSLLREGVALVYECLGEPSGWTRVESISSALLAQQLSNRVVQQLVGE